MVQLQDEDWRDPLIEESKILSQNPDGLDCLVKNLDSNETPEESMAKIRKFYDNYKN